MRSMILSILMFCTLLTGCFTINLGGNNDDKQEVNNALLANPLNVYRTSTNIVIKAKVQNKKGKWVESKTDVLIPSGWYLISGTSLDDGEEIK